MRHLSTTIVPIIVRAQGDIKKATYKRINKITGSPSPCEIQKDALCRSVHNLRGILSM